MDYWVDFGAEACAFLAPSLGGFGLNKQNLWQDLHKTASAMKKNQMQTCHASIQKQIEETT